MRIENGELRVMKRNTMLSYANDFASVCIYKPILNFAYPPPQQKFKNSRVPKHSENNLNSGQSWSWQFYFSFQP